MDLLIPGQSPGIKERLVDLYGKPELLFFGPDGKPSLSEDIKQSPNLLILEGTADMMDWAACMPLHSLTPRLQLIRVPSTCTIPWSRMVEVFHHRQECEDARWCSARHLRHDISVYSSVRPGYLQAARTSGEGHHESTNWWTWYVVNAK